MARGPALAAALAVSLLAVSGAGGAATQQTPKRGGTVAVAEEFEPSCLNPLIAPCREVPIPISSVLKGAFKLAPDYSLQPDIVSGVDYTTTPPFTFTYRIRREARWSDGVPITARDFVFTYKALRTHAALENIHRTYIRSVRAVDSRTLRVSLGSRFAFWRFLFPYVLPAHALQGEDLASTWIGRIDNPKTGEPIGSGPFLVGSWDRGRQLTLVRNPRYWGGHRAYLDRIVLRFALDTGDIGGLFRSRAADVGQWQFREDLVSELRRIPGIGLRALPDAPGWEHLDVRVGPGGHPALKSKLVRQALAFGIDRVAIVQALFGEAAPGLRPLDSVLFRSSSRSFRPNWSRYRHRPAETRRLLTQAGCRSGADGVFTCAGERLSLRFVSRGVIDRRVRTLELVQRQLRQAGVEVVVEYAPSAAHDQILERGRFDATLFAWFGPGADGDDVKSLYGCGGSQNYTGYCQRLVTRDLDQAGRILEARRRARVLNRVDAQLARDVPVIPLFEVPAIAAVRSTVRNYVAHFTDPTWNAEEWWLDR